MPSDEEIRAKVGPSLKKITLVVATFLILGLLTFTYFSGRSELFKGFIGSNGEAYELEIVKILPVALDDTECIADEGCKTRIKIKKTGSGIPGENPEIFLKINDIISGEVSVPSVKDLGANEGEVYFTIPETLFFPKGAQSEIRVEIVGGSFTMLTFTPPDETGDLNCSNPLNKFSGGSAAVDNKKDYLIDMKKEFFFEKVLVDTDKAAGEVPIDMLFGGFKAGSNSEIPLAISKIENYSKVIPVSENLQKVEIEFQADFYNGANHPYDIEEVSFCAAPVGDENCFNNIDDDADGFKDCNDAYCALGPQCVDTLSGKLNAKLQRQKSDGSGYEEVDFLDLSNNQARLILELNGHSVNNYDLVIKQAAIYAGDSLKVSAEAGADGKTVIFEHSPPKGTELPLTEGSYMYKATVGYDDADAPTQILSGSFEVKEKAEAESGDDAPPSLVMDFEDDSDQENDDDDEEENENDSIKITKAEAQPKEFNPTGQNTKIVYAFSKDAIIELKITDEAGQILVHLILNQSIKAGEYFRMWDGRKDGAILPAGKYKFQINAKNPVTGETEDSKEGELIVSLPAPPASQSPASQPTSPGIQSQANATVALQNSTETSATGPGIAIYSLIPLIGYLATRKKS